MPNIKNLWPETILNGDDILLPVTILNEQAKYFNELSRNVVVASVETKSIAMQSRKNIRETVPAILHILKIYAPAIGNYDFDLVRVSQEEVLPYPVKMHIPLLEITLDINDDKEFENYLSGVLSDKKIVATIQSLLLQSRQ